MSMRVNIHGISRVVQNAEQFEDKIIKATKKAMIKTALVDIESGAKKKITQDGHIDTGRLRASIHTSYEGKESHVYNDLEGNNFTSRINVDRRFFQVKVGTTTEYAMYIEALDSFVYYAFQKSKPKLQQRLKREVGKVLRGR